MIRKWMIGALGLLIGVAGCADEPLAPSQSSTATPQFHAGAPASSCPLVQLPASARVGLCFTTTLIPGVWHGWILELSNAQPSGATNGQSDRLRLNHPYVLAAPNGYRKLGTSELGTPFENIHAFQAESNGVLWFDVLRLQASANDAPQTVPIVVFWVDATGIGGDLNAAINALLAAAVINGGQANALTRKINQALSLLARGKTAEATVVLQGFIQQVNDLTNIDFVLSPAQADQLITWAQYMIASV